jgi:Xaa-Pro aminopeptidase
MKSQVSTRRVGWLLAALLVCTVIVPARVRQPNEEYQARRAKLRAQVDGPVVLFAYTEKESASIVKSFFQEENFYYLTGHNQAGAALLLIPEPPNGNKYDGPREIFYLPPRNPAEERWNGPQLGPDDPGAAEKTGFAAVESFPSLHGDLEKLDKIFPNFYTALPTAKDTGYPHNAEWLAWLKQAMPQADFRDITKPLGALRQQKSPGEIALLQKAIDLSVDAQLEAMKMMRPGLRESQVAARMVYIHAFGGCDREAYDPIVGAGFHSTVLHYSAGDTVIQEGDVVVLDVGGEYGGYAADLTRTLPANGKFTPRQREIYEIVLGAQNAALAALKPSMNFSRTEPNSVYKIAYDYINTHGKDKEGRPLGQYFIHGLGHHIGLEVHDAGDPYRALEPGMVVTMEPGIYIPEENLGARIEDDVLITNDGYKMMSARLPRTIAEIETIMAAARKHPQQLP